MEKYVLSLLVENNFGVLSRIAGLFARRGFNIDSLTVGKTENQKISRMTITVTGDQQVLEQIIKQLNKLIEVIKIVELTPKDSVNRELVFIKVKADNHTRCDIIAISNIFRANIIDISPNTLILQITGDEDKIEALMEMLSPFGILEFIRSGITGLQRGDKVIHLSK
ncbi:acetolactate synthase small subunit [Garciella nitratireducens]|uniref:Acetolactate synthase small subunit n=1 Tax=Garciella nitratireducens DSM 15102 TaxID=1121911 RepID=A0A1T4N101_9FIRM|nr:acetolactate synthase small subunit [Garciella nitratireducens]RBP42722.1 acetolactate synthase small subunit [Garciella nitratireducens]SJZ72707.1 acetolactate synthase, small subunit [Garciella nitratireducens DSM 15102]